MKQEIIFSLAYFLFYSISLGQSSETKMLYIIDSIPILTDPEELNPILEEEIADTRVMRSKDTLRLFEYDKIDGITYIFTKEYRNRPDSLKLIPSLRQMVMKNNVWNLRNTPYSGKYIDYFNSGKIQDAGTLLNGKLNGELVVYFNNGNKKLVAHYQDGNLEGEWNDYYSNGALLQTRRFSEGKEEGGSKMYFINGQSQTEVKNGMLYDTIFQFYSTGKIRGMVLSKNHKIVLNKTKETINYYTTLFNENLRAGDIKEANKSFFKIWQADSSSIETYFLEGLLHLRESHFERAIADFDNALIKEPMMREALVHRALARIRQNQLLQEKTSSKNSNVVWTIKGLQLIPKYELDRICIDIQQAEYVDSSESYVKKIIPELFFNYCLSQSSR